MERSYKHTVKIDNLKEFDVWQENGNVCQNGWLSLPQYFAEFNNTRQGREQAGAFISGMLLMLKIINETKV